MSTIREVSRRANVSVSTVSRVLNGTTPVAEPTRRRVLEAIEDLDYRPNAFARGLATNRSGGIGITINDISSPYYGAILRGVEEVVEEAGMHLMVSSGHARAGAEREAVEFLLERRVDAVIVQAEGLSDEDLLELDRATDTPVVVFGRLVAELERRCVRLDNETGGEIATRHLLAHGHRRVAHIAGPLAYPDSRDRLHGYRRALEQAGIGYDDRLVVESDFRETGGVTAARRLLERAPDLSAIFVANDQMAAGALRAVRDAGRSVPSDISLVGYDDVLLARYLYPALTTVRQPLREMGRAAAEIALERLDTDRGDTTKEVRREFDPELVIRQSVANPAT